MEKKVGLALAGGGLRGSYEIGAFYALKESKIKFDMISGTSIGSFNGAMIVAHQEQELLEFWETVDPIHFLELDEIFKAKEISLKKLDIIVKTIKSKIKNHGFNLSPLKIKLEEIFNEEKFRQSTIDYGVVTIKSDGVVPVEVTKKDIPKGKTIEYILASCYLPIFKKEKLIDDNYYLDGGFHDSVPIEILVNNGCNKIYAVYLNGPGPQKKIKNPEIEIIKIKPKKNLGSQLTLDTDKIRENIKLGYYDTLKVIKNLDGINYYFKNNKLRFYDKLLRKVDKKMLNKAYLRFLGKNNRDLIIKALECVIKKEKLELYKIYSPYDIIRVARRNTGEQGFEYKFVRKLKLFWEW